MKYMRNYATEGDFTADTTTMDQITNSGKTWISYTKDPKKINIGFKERPVEAIYFNDNDLAGGLKNFDNTNNIVNSISILNEDGSYSDISISSGQISTVLQKCD